MAEKLSEVNASKGLHAQFDEQYSRSQRYLRRSHWRRFSQLLDLHMVQLLMQRVLS